MKILQAIPARVLIIISIITIAVLSIWHITTTYSIVDIKIQLHDNISANSKIYLVKNNSQDQEVTPLFGTSYIIDRQTIALRATADRHATIKEFTPKSISDSTTVNIYSDRNATKYSDSSLSCITYTKDTDRLLSYNCIQPKQLVEYKSVSNTMPGNVSVATITQQDTDIYSIKPYDGGVIGIQIPRLHTVQTNQFIFMIDNDGTKTTGNVPDSIDQSHLGAMNILTDSTSSNSNFALTSKSTGKIFFSDNKPQQTTTYKEYTLPDDFSINSDSLICTLVDTTVFCYYGPSSHPHDDIENPTLDIKEKDGSLLSIDFISETPSIKRYGVDKKNPIDSLFVSQNKQLYAMSKENFSVIDLKDNRATVRPYISEPSSVSVGNGLLFIRQNAVYKYDDTTKESYLVFQSPKLNLSSITEVNDEIFINAYTKNNSGERIHTYKINDEPNNNPNPRLIDVLPLDFDESPDISDMSFYKNNLYIRIKMTISKTSGSGRIDQTAFEQAKQRISKILEEKSVDIDNINIHYLY